jgi:hypothetical protein
MVQCGAVAASQSYARKVPLFYEWHKRNAANYAIHKKAVYSPFCLNNILLHNCYT